MLTLAASPQLGLAFFLQQRKLLCLKVAAQVTGCLLRVAKSARHHKAGCPLRVAKSARLHGSSDDFHFNTASKTTLQGSSFSVPVLERYLQPCVEPSPPVLGLHGLGEGICHLE